MVVHSTTYMPEDGAPKPYVPAEIKEALVMLEKDTAQAVLDGFTHLSHATFNNPVGKEAAGGFGAIEAIVKAMDRFNDNGEVLTGACHALRNIAFHCEPNLALVRDQGALTAVIKAMEKHPSIESLQMEGMWALVVFCSNHDDNIAMAKPHLTILRKAVETYPNNEDIKLKGTFLQALLQ
ncbi:TPA: hypothetical protein N0F65_002401 [Lagenidium giganteum]|uniref:Uncharacterized protein n=1 Tax=Lagenidium giganteum TaxID=4803 RepID=A0AAV2YLT6_9STRA|nr:TPA: hypothetical protein N0F65_002401 [Lagenidium giganteum]